MNIPKKLLANKVAIDTIGKSAKLTDVEIIKLQSSLMQLNNKQKISILTNQKNAQAVRDLSNSQLALSLGLEGYNTKQNRALVNKIKWLQKLNLEVNLTEKQIAQKKMLQTQIAEEMNLLDPAGAKKQGISWGTTAVMAAMSAITAYSSSRQAQNGMEAAGKSLGAGLMSGISGAMVGAQIGGGWGALAGFLGGVAVTAVSSWIGWLVGQHDRLTNKANELNQALNQQRQTLQQTGQTIKSISPDWERLSKGVDRNGKNISLTTQEFEEFNRMQTQIAEMFPHLIKGYTDEGQVILSLRGDVERLKEEYENLQQTMLDTIVLQSSDLWDGFRESTQGTSFGLKGYSSTLQNEVAVLDVNVK
jgi:hypothetical protein